ncbi:MAG: hypothetical protein JRG76_15815 [Deltaproteobacteria bacterium]|nr:hypothetical protein [Deltaproteobacteria bacterium]MBW2415966.1 hypothetical protein [Deltaproteobacteria bacterium]
MDWYFVGDSITSGGYPGQIGGTYPDRIEGVRAHRSAVSGTTTTWWVQRLSEFPEAEGASILLGTNDAVGWQVRPADYALNMQALADRLLEHYPRVVLVTPPTSPGYEELLAAYGDRLLDICESSDRVDCADAHARLDYPEHFVDRLHPNAEGQELIAAALHEQIYATEGVPLWPAGVALLAGLVAVAIWRWRRYPASGMHA